MLLCVAGTMHSVLIKGGVLIAGVVSYTFLCEAGGMRSVLIKCDIPIFRDVHVCPYGVILFKLLSLHCFRDCQMSTLYMPVLKQYVHT